MVLEQWPGIRDKVCGDGISVFCVPQLARLGIGEKELLEAGALPILRKKEFFGNEEKTTVYEKPCYGLPRPILMGLLSHVALRRKVRIHFGFPVQKVEKEGDFYVVNHHLAGKIVVNAMGAVSFLRLAETRDLPFGISSRIFGNPSGIDNHCYHFYYGPDYGNGYAWIFPIGNGLWNVGVWNGDKRKDVAEAYRQFERSLFGEEPLNYDRKPGGAFIGASNGKVALDLPALGDAAYLASYSSGEGITYALQSAIDYAETVVL